VPPPPPPSTDMAFLNECALIILTIMKPNKPTI
jgi:hypothetical protein